MMTITMTIKQYNAIRRLADFAEWYIDEHEGSGLDNDQWLEDKKDVTAGVKALEEVGQQTQFS